VQVSSSEGVANHTVPESCAGAREGFGEALTGVRIGATKHPDQGGNGSGEQLLADHTHLASKSVGPRVRTVATKAAIKVQTTTVCRNVPARPKTGSGLATARSRHIQPIATRCPSSTRPRPRRGGPADQAPAQPIAWSA